MIAMDEFLRAAIEEAEQGFAEGGIPIGSVLAHILSGEFERLSGEFE